MSDGSHSSSSSDNEHDPTQDHDHDHEHPKWDPSAKPKKGILRKDGEHHEKKEGHIALKADEDKDAEKKPAKKLPVEGISGVVVKGQKGQGIVKKKDPNDKTHQMIQRKPLDPTKAAALSASGKSPRSSEEHASDDKEKDKEKEKKKDKSSVDKEKKKDKN
eukprot:TRINITY_DN8713_c0_g1_i1.p1 TRINITY_DN8713_c0_g1~~TRINITY_DN8713_c0_g1_i1.p1  ORF type:complete len:161 (+),score=52.42 TRINITY_DN8713_c0_g1_i1:122-604(+)